MERLRERSGGEFDLSEGTVYPALYRLERERLLSSRWAVVGGRRRRVYSVTRSGRRALAERRRDWVAFAAAVRNTRERYVRELEARLPFALGVRRRVLAEVREHLREGQDALVRFGPVDELAAELAGELRLRAEARASWLVPAAVVAFVFPFYVVPENTLPPAPWVVKPDYLAWPSRRFSSPSPPRSWRSSWPRPAAPLYLTAGTSSRPISATVSRSSCARCWSMTRS